MTPWPNAYRARPRVPRCAFALCAGWCRRGFAVAGPSCPTLSSLSLASERFVLVVAVEGKLSTAALHVVGSHNRELSASRTAANPNDSESEDLHKHNTVTGDLRV